MSMGGRVPVLQKALGFLGFRVSPLTRPLPDYRSLMQSSLDRVDSARQMLREARTLEELDMARSSLQQAQAEVQHLIRAAKRDQGLTLRPIAETEQLYRRLWDRIQSGSATRHER